MDLYPVNFDGTHAPCTKGRQKVSYKGQEKEKQRMMHCT